MIALLDALEMVIVVKTDALHGQLGEKPKRYENRTTSLSPIPASDFPLNNGPENSLIA
ncbi:MAG: hypothetical protein PVG02_06450 [Anaerolineales bacterium]|jgi:hypothetical protein